MGRMRVSEPDPSITSRSPLGRRLRLFGTSSIGSVWLGLSVAAIYLLLHVAFDATVWVLGNFPPGESPILASDQWWTDLINAAIIGYLPAAQAIARRGVARDLSELRSELRVGEAEFAALREKATGQGGSISRALALSGIPFGAWLAFTDPTMTLSITKTATDPVFVWALGRTMLMGWLGVRFGVYDFNTTRIYLALGRTAAKVDLLDIRSLSRFVRRGQRSALTWVLFSTIFSLFWLGDAAAQSNLSLLLVVLSMATFSFVGPLVALRQNIVAEKRKELDVLREQIRLARNGPEAARTSPQLANTVAYYQLIESAGEWPIDAANLLRFIAYLFLGLGSWLGGAVAERMLDTALRG
jgi:hypothetical protein